MQNSPPNELPTTFKERFCFLAKCRQEQYEKRVLSLCMHSDHPWLARLYCRFDRRSFESDLEMIRRLGGTSTFDEFKRMLEAWRASHPSKGYLRKQLHFRVSGKNLLKLASRILKSPHLFGFNRSQASPHAGTGHRQPR